MFTSGMKESQWTEEEGKTVQVEHFHPYWSILNIFVNSWYFALFWTFCLILDFCSMLNILLQWNFLDHVQTKRFLAGYCFTSCLLCFFPGVCWTFWSHLKNWLMFLIAGYCFTRCLRERPQSCSWLPLHRQEDNHIVCLLLFVVCLMSTQAGRQSYCLFIINCLFVVCLMPTRAGFQSYCFKFQ